MPSVIANTVDLVGKVYTLARPYGRKKLVLVTALSFVQGIFQVLGVTSIFPFLALAADPSQLRNSQIGHQVLELLPDDMDDTQIFMLAGTFAICMLLLANGINLVAEYVRTHYAHSFGHWLRLRLLRQIASRSHGYFLQENSSVLVKKVVGDVTCLLYTSPSPRDKRQSRMPSSA